MDEPECVDDPEECNGPVEFHSVDPGRTQAWPRCQHHWNLRIERMSDSIEAYANSDVPPDWFDPTLAGERWEED